MSVLKDSRLAVRLSSDQDALICRAAEVEGTSITEFTVDAAMSHARDLLVDRRLFVLDDAAWTEFLAVLDRVRSRTSRGWRSCLPAARPSSERVLDPAALDREHGLAELDSGEPSLDDWLRKRAVNQPGDRRFALPRHLPRRARGRVLRVGHRPRPAA